MIPFANLLAVIIIFVNAVIFWWIISLAIINSKKVMVFVPFVILNVWLCVDAALNFYGIYDPKIWFVFESFWGILFLWILIILIKNKNV
jgi:hypothetical protein